ncbi:DNA invertase Pin-like site-specific DNA recombinase [Sphingomonas faeni]|uniref:DNA invertase Pin-like site-specific DNA recombinase n=1 Tax=Sphingomonas faeni TaxID=185950 RepID=A0A2T5U276_9SPHN|nr:recombinase family protein [Sphingomonas faeni]PTW45598.1 DNA invertase Pin-like site-specific DNA recombinase [Sphingomonas faeni]
MIVGYARVSTTDQDNTIQTDALTAAGAEKVFAERKSGTTAINRDQLHAAIDFVREGDTLICTRLDRLARSAQDLLTIIQTLADKGVGFRCAEQAGVDTTTISGKLTLTILAAVAEFETAIRKERQLEGIAAAKAKGTVYKGRQPSIDVAKVRDMRASGHGPAAIAKAMGITRQSVYRVTKEG